MIHSRWAIVRLVLWLGIFFCPNSMAAEMLHMRHHTASDFLPAWGAGIRNLRDSAGDQDGVLSRNRRPASQAPFSFTTYSWSFRLDPFQPSSKIYRGNRYTPSFQVRPWGELPQGDACSPLVSAHGQLWLYIQEHGSWNLFHTPVQSDSARWSPAGGTSFADIRNFFLNQDADPSAVSFKENTWLLHQGVFTGGGRSLQWIKETPITHMEAESLIRSANQPESLPELMGEFDLGQEATMLAFSWKDERAGSIQLRYRISENSDRLYGPWSQPLPDDTVQLNKKGRYFQYQLAGKGSGSPGTFALPDLTLTYTFGDPEKVEQETKLSSGGGSAGGSGGSGGLASSTLALSFTPMSAIPAAWDEQSEHPSSGNKGQDASPDPLSRHPSDEHPQTLEPDPPNSDSGNLNQQQENSSNSEQNPEMKEKKSSNQKDQEENPTPDSEKNSPKKQSESSDSSNPQSDSDPKEKSDDPSRASDQSTNPEEPTGDSLVPKTHSKSESTPDSQPHNVEPSPHNQPEADPSQLNPYHPNEQTPHSSSSANDPQKNPPTDSTPENSPSDSPTATDSSENNSETPSTESAPHANPQNPDRKPDGGNSTESKPSADADGDTGSQNDSGEQKNPSEISNSNPSSPEANPDSQPASSNPKKKSPEETPENPQDDSPSMHPSPSASGQPAGGNGGGGAEMPSDSASGETTPDAPPEKERPSDGGSDIAPPPPDEARDNDSALLSEPPKFSGGNAGSSSRIDSATADSPRDATSNQDIRSLRIVPQRPASWWWLLLLLGGLLLWIWRRKKTASPPESFSILEAEEPDWCTRWIEEIEECGGGWNQVITFHENSVCADLDREFLLLMDTEGTVQQIPLLSFLDGYDAVKKNPPEILTRLHNAWENARMLKHHRQLFILGEDLHHGGRALQVDLPAGNKPGKGKKIIYPEGIESTHRLQEGDGALWIMGKSDEGIQVLSNSFSQLKNGVWRKDIPPVLEGGRIMALSGGNEPLLAGIPPHDRERLWIYHLKKQNGKHWRTVGKSGFHGEGALIHASQKRCILMETEQDKQTCRLNLFPRDEQGLFTTRASNTVSLPYRGHFFALSIVEGHLFLLGREEIDAPSGNLMLLIGQIGELLKTQSSLAA